VLVRFRGASEENITPAVIKRIQQDRVCWAGGTQWLGGPAMRIAVSGWKTGETDAITSADAMISAFRAVRDARTARPT
jgi:hypothetical protein